MLLTEWKCAYCFFILKIILTKLHFLIHSHFSQEIPSLWQFCNQILLPNFRQHCLLPLKQNKTKKKKKKKKKEKNYHLERSLYVKLRDRMSNGVDPDETAHYEPSHLDLCCLQKPSIIACDSERVNLYTYYAHNAHACVVAFFLFFFFDRQT